MTIGAVALLAYVAARLAAASSANPQSRDFGCTEWHQCRELALAAADRGEYETFHDLAWRRCRLVHERSGPDVSARSRSSVERSTARRAGHAPASRRDGRRFRCSHQRRLRSHAAAARVAGLVGSHRRAEPSIAADCFLLNRNPAPIPAPGTIAGTNQHRSRHRSRHHPPADRQSHRPRRQRRRAPGSRPRVLRSADSRTTRCRADSFSAIGSGASCSWWAKGRTMPWTSSAPTPRDLATSRRWRSTTGVEISGS